MRIATGLLLMMGLQVACQSAVPSAGTPAPVPAGTPAPLPPEKDPGMGYVIPAPVAKAVNPNAAATLTHNEQKSPMTCNDVPPHGYCDGNTSIRCDDKSGLALREDCS